MAKIQFLMSTVVVTCVLLINISESSPSSQQLKTNIENALSKLQKNSVVKEQIPCTCGVFLTGQFKRGSSDPPRGNPALMVCLLLFQFLKSLEVINKLQYSLA